MILRREPLSFYVEKLRRGEPFTVLTYGDGEFTVMSGARNGTYYTNYREYVTGRLAGELVRSLDAPGDDLLRGSDPFLLQPETYGGRDVASVRDVAAKAARVLGDRVLTWYDGTVWDAAVREGKLGPLLGALRGREVYLIAHPAVYHAVKRYDLFPLWWFHAVPPEDAAGSWEVLADAIPEEVDWKNGSGATGMRSCFLVCCGLSAIPLCLRIRERNPSAAVLDLGSTFDLFAGLGGERGWRSELYADGTTWQDVLRRNLEGV